MTIHVVSVAKDFSRHPAGRYTADGEFSGEAFRREFLLPALRENRPILVYLDGVRGYESAFLEEAFGGLVREGFAPARVRNAIQFQSRDAELIEQIHGYILKASQLASGDL